MGLRSADFVVLVLYLGRSGYVKEGRIPEGAAPVPKLP